MNTKRIIKSYGTMHWDMLSNYIIEAFAAIYKGKKGSILSIFLSDDGLSLG